MWLLELAGVAHQGSCLTSSFFFVALVDHAFSNTVRVATMAYMQRTFFRFVDESDAVVVLRSSILLAILITPFKFVELDGLFYFGFHRGYV